MVLAAAVFWKLKFSKDNTDDLPNLQPQRRTRYRNRTIFLLFQHETITMSTADELKALGNKAIAAKDFDEAM